MSLGDIYKRDDDALMLHEINARFERFIEAKGHPEKILVLLKEIM